MFKIVRVYSFNKNVKKVIDKIFDKFYEQDRLK